MIGLFIHAFNAITIAPLHYRALERDKVKHLFLSQNNFDSFMCPSVESVREVTWWFDNVEKLNGKPIRFKSVDIWIKTDASNSGWGAHVNGLFAGGRWKTLESTNHINYLELLAIFFALRSFYSTNSFPIHIGIKSDNSSAISYINNMGGMTSVTMDCLAVDIWNWCIERNIHISAQYLPGLMNIEADNMSRNFSDSCEWSLKYEIFLRICKHFFTPNIDLFASRMNKKLQVFASWSFDPDSHITDAFSVAWTDFQPYIFPPFCLIARVLNKIDTDNADRAILIVPFWPSQSWFPLLISALIYFPARLPRHRDLLVLPHSEENHPLSRKMTLVACVVSGKASRREDFQNCLLSSSLPLGGNQLLNSTNYAGGNGIFGVRNGTLVPFTQLKLM